ncbi:MAG: DUF4398 domain-containing protein, partial [Rhodanobacteraceae bacterium]
MARMRAKIHQLVPLFALALAGCASAPPPTGLLDRADAQIRAAQDAGAATHAPDDFAEAQRRMALAQDAASRGDNDTAAAGAQEAQAAAETARARARAADLQAQIQAKADENARLQADLEQRQATAAAAQAAGTVPPAGGSTTELPPIDLGAPGSPVDQPVPSPPASSSTTELPPIELGAPGSPTDQSVPPPDSLDTMP